MKRAYFATEDLQELETIEAELEQKGIASEHMHVLTQAEADASERDLHPVHSILRTGPSPDRRILSFCFTGTFHYGFLYLGRRTDRDAEEQLQVRALPVFAQTRVACLFCRLP